MRFADNFNPEWGYLAPAPSFMRTARVALVAAAIGAASGAAVVVSLIDRPAAKETSIAARTLVQEPSDSVFAAMPAAQLQAPHQVGSASDHAAGPPASRIAAAAGSALTEIRLLRQLPPMTRRLLPRRYRRRRLPENSRYRARVSHRARFARKLTATCVNSNSAPERPWRFCPTAAIRDVAKTTARTRHTKTSSWTTSTGLSFKKLFVRMAAQRQAPWTIALSSTARAISQSGRPIASLVQPVPHGVAALFDQIWQKPSSNCTTA